MTDTALHADTTIHEDLEMLRAWAQYLGATECDDELLTAAGRLWASVHDLEESSAELRSTVRNLARRFDGRPPEDSHGPAAGTRSAEREELLALAARLNGDTAVGAC